MVEPAGALLLMLGWIVMQRRWRRAVIAFLAAAMVLMFLVGSTTAGRQTLGNVLLNRFATLGSLASPDSSSDNERWILLSISWQMFLDHPLTGVGPGNFPHHQLDYDPRASEDRPVTSFRIISRSTLRLRRACWGCSHLAGGVGACFS